MKTTLAVATFAALVGVAGAANAADLYKGGSLKDAPVYVAPPTWTGFYLGGHVGGAWGELNNRLTDYYSNELRSLSYDYAPDWKISNDGVFGGGTIGYNFQSSAFVFGVEADFGVIGFSNTDHFTYGGYDTGLWHKQDSSFYADVTGRLGYAAGPALFYAKGGWAYLDNASSFGYGPYEIIKEDALNGWTVGGGIEYLWSPSWSVKAEYQYFDFGKNSHDITYDGYKYGSYENDLTINTFKVGINYHFANNAYAPLK